MALEQNRFMQQPAARRKTWISCWGGLSCFQKQKGGTRIVPATRIPEGNGLLNQQNGPQAIGLLPNQTNGIALSLFAPPSSPASFSNSALASTAPSPNCFLSTANSPSSTMFVTGPYAHETQLVSPPVFSTFTTEPSTAPLTPPPELAHLTTPSSPEVPYARFLSSSKIKTTIDKANSGSDLQSTYSLYPESPASTLRSPISRMSDDLSPSSFAERELSAYVSSDSGRFQATGGGGLKPRRDSNFFCPETFAQFYEQSNNGGRLSISKESDASTNGHQNRQIRTPRPDAEELEAYRASFGFSADEITTTTHCVEITDVLEGMTPPFTSTKPVNDNMQDSVSCPQELDEAGRDLIQGLHSGA